MAVSKHRDQDASSKYDKKQYPASSERNNEEHDMLNDERLQSGKEKYIRESGNIEDLRGNGGEPVDENSKNLTDQSGKEKNEEYINTEERKKS
jgi:hypothetical protein